MRIMKRNKGIDPVEVKDELAEIMSGYVRVIRHEDGLRKAAQVLERIKQDKIGNLCLTGERSFKELAKPPEVEGGTQQGGLFRVR